jgi:hypothetical protein
LCVEQAYYAEMIGKAIGVPTATISARGEDVGHAWVGYLRTQGRRLEWDMSEGLYKEYRGEAATTRDPQTNREISDGDLRMKASRAGYAHEAVTLALALADAAGLASERSAALDMLERSVTACPYIPESWDRVIDLARQQPLEREELERWGGAVMRLCGTEYPDFAIKVMTPLVNGLRRHEERGTAWSWIRERVVESQNNRAYYRYDLSVALRLREADCLAGMGNHDGAWKVCWEAVRKFGRETPAVKPVAMRCESMLRIAGSPPERLASFWKDAWEQTDKPKDMSPKFAMASNWSVFGLKYADWLERSGEMNKAEQVRKRILPRRKDD